MSFDSGAAALLASGLAGLLLGVAVYSLMGRRETVADRVSAYVTLRRDDDGEESKSLVERALGDKQARKIARSPLIVRQRIEMEVADIKLSFEQFTTLSLVGGVFVGWLLYASTRSVIAALLALFVPVAGQLAIRMRAGRQRRKFADQLPDNLQVVASAMRSGQTFVGALKAVLEDAPEPSKSELGRAVMDEQIGISLSDALSGVTERMKSEDFQHVAVVAALQRETGGNTAEVIELVAETVRERTEIRRMVRGLTAQGRLSGGILSMMPVAMLIFISVINPQYVHPLFHSTTGLIALGVALGLVGLGVLVIKKIIEIKV
jgi:tight adherence protein B